MWNCWQQKKGENLAEDMQPMGHSLGNTDPRRQESNEREHSTLEVLTFAYKIGCYFNNWFST